MSDYQDTKSKFETYKCKECCGLGTDDDAEPGDIGYDEWPCEACNGTVFAKGIIYRLVEL